MATQLAAETNIDEAAPADLRSRVRGSVLCPGDEGYEAARTVYNAMIDRRPAVIARCVDVADVISAVNFAREQRLTLAVRGGGHNGAGLGTCDGGLVIDLSPMKGTRVDPEARTVRAGGGCTWGDVDHATHAFGLATPSGIISTTGVGLALGGGIGYLTRACGLSIDNILEVDMVLADGRFVTANADQHPDLFWAVRGGGGNFGVVTSLLFKLHQISTVYAGPMLWHFEQSTEVMRWYRDFIASAPDQINGFFAFLTVPPGPPFPEHLHAKKMCGVVWCYTGPLDLAEAVFAPIRRLFGGPALDFVGPLPQPALQSMFDALYPPGHQWYWRADFVNELSDEAIAQHIDHAAFMPSMQSTMHLYPINGAAGRVGKTETPWSYRDALWGEVIVGVDPDPTRAAELKDWTIAYWEAVHPYSAGGAYVNMMMDEGQERVRAAYRENYDRLAAVKNTYDPHNLFHVNQNIKPSAS